MNEPRRFRKFTETCIMSAILGANLRMGDMGIFQYSSLQRITAVPTAKLKLKWRYKQWKSDNYTRAPRVVYSASWQRISL